MVLPSWQQSEVDGDTAVIGRRSFLRTLSGSLLAAPLAAEAQQTGPVPRLGVLSPASPSAFGYAFDAFRQGLRDLGYVEGGNLIIEWRWAEGKYERLSALAADLVRLKVDCIVTHGVGSRVAKDATATIPIVMASGGNLVGEGLVSSLARPAGNLTGVSFSLPDLAARRLELLKEAVPSVSRVAFLFNPANVTAFGGLEALERSARGLNVTLQPIAVREPGEFDGAFSVMAARQPDALAVIEDWVITLSARRVATQAMTQRLPSVGFLEWAEAGGLMAYDADIVSVYNRAAAYVDKILKGAKPVDLPIEQAAKFKLIINRNAANALGLTIPPSLLRRADQVIE
jgi:putative ABC transport system substrate-binding protein